MNLNILKLAQSTILCASLLTSAAFCEEVQQPSTSRVPVATRPMDKENRLKMKDQREELPIQETTEPAREEKAASSQYSRHAAKAANPSKKGALFSNEYNSSSYHWLASASVDGTIIELEDGSNWKLSPNYAVFNWKVADPIVITPNHSFFSEYNYYVVNKFTGSYIPADLILGPVAYGPYTHWVIGVDYAAGHVYLENGTAWTVSVNDTFIFNDWAINDTVIIGSNDSWFSSYDTILINVNMNNYVRSKKY